MRAVLFQLFFKLNLKIKKLVNLVICFVKICDESGWFFYITDLLHISIFCMPKQLIHPKLLSSVKQITKKQMLKLFMFYFLLKNILFSMSKLFKMYFDQRLEWKALKGGSKHTTAKYFEDLFIFGPKGVYKKIIIHSYVWWGFFLCTFMISKSAFCWVVTLLFSI